MEAGMMWFDNDKKTSLTEKVNAAAAYYLKKYGRSPDLCMVNPKTLGGKEPRARKIVIRSDQYILPGHLWIGIKSN